MTTTTTPLNAVHLRGKLAAPIELATYASGRTAARLLVTILTETPVRRVDVLPVTLWDPVDTLDPDLPTGTVLDIAAEVRRWFWAAEDGRRSRLELVSSAVTVIGGAA